ncbi:MAG: hypothetical protein ACOVNV_05160, partial [Pirellulaceae bacterium]
ATKRGGRFFLEFSAALKLHPCSHRGHAVESFVGTSLPYVHHLAMVATKRGGRFFLEFSAALKLPLGSHRGHAVESFVGTSLPHVHDLAMVASARGGIGRLSKPTSAYRWAV